MGRRTKRLICFNQESNGLNCSYLLNSTWTPTNEHVTYDILTHVKASTHISTTYRFSSQSLDSWFLFFFALLIDHHLWNIRITKIFNSFSCLILWLRIIKLDEKKWKKKKKILKKKNCNFSLICNCDGENAFERY